MRSVPLDNTYTEFIRPGVYAKEPVLDICVLLALCCEQIIYVIRDTDEPVSELERHCYFTFCFETHESHDDVSVLFRQTFHVNVEIYTRIFIVLI